MSRPAKILESSDCEPVAHRPLETRRLGLFNLQLVCLSCQLAAEMCYTDCVKAAQIHFYTGGNFKAILIPFFFSVFHSLV